MTDLLPCPFCGEAAHIHVYPPTCRPETPYNPADRLFPIARCAKCFAEVAGKNEDYGMKSAIAAWNTRASTTEIEKLRTALEGAIGALEFSRDYHSDLGNEEQAFAQDRLDAARAALATPPREGSDYQTEAS